jgi:hypothetical protein
VKQIVDSESCRLKIEEGKSTAAAVPDMFPIRRFVSESAVADLLQQVRWRDGVECLSLPF